MIIEGVIGNVQGTRRDHARVDWVDIDWQQTVRRCLRLTSRGGRRADLLLPREHPTLRDGDVLATLSDATVDGSPVQLALAVRPCPVLRLCPSTMKVMGLLCAEIGNQHWPVEIAMDAVIALDDGPLREIADHLRVSYDAVTAPFHPERFSVPIVVDRSR